MSEFTESQQMRTARQPLLNEYQVAEQPGNSWYTDRV